MNWKGAVRAAWMMVRPVMPGVIEASTAALGVPMVGVFLNAAIFAQDRASDGKGRFAVGVEGLQIAAPYIIADLERQLGRDIPEDAAAAYMRAQLQAHVDLMNAIGLLPKGGK